MTDPAGDPGQRAVAARVPGAAAIGEPLPVPRYEDVAGGRFPRRASCCLIEESPSGSRCTSCPRRPPAERLELLRQAAAWF